MVSAKIAAAEENEGECIMASHFCRHNNLSNNTITSIIFSIASSAKKYLKDYKNYLKENDLEEKNKLIQDPTNLFNLLIAKPLSNILPPKGSSKELIIFDAMDELSRESLLAMIKIIEECFSNLLNWVVFFITAYREQNIADALHNLSVS